jgi:hypothetical protein
MADEARIAAKIRPQGDYGTAVFPVGSGETGLRLRWRGGGAPPGALVVLFDPRRGVRLNKWLRPDETPEIGADGASMGGIPGLIDEGQWEARLFLPLPAGAGAELLVEFAPQSAGKGGKKICRGGFLDGYDPKKTARNAAGWYKGDFHTHTLLSDGKETAESATEKAERMGLDFYVPTEHNVLHTSWPDTRLLIVPGLEMTSLGGHCNVFGLDAPPEALYAPRNWRLGFLAPDALKVLLEQCAGCVCSLNHPFLREWSWRVPDIPLDLFHTLEVVNDPTYPYADDANENALRLWTRLWNDGRRIYGVGGSDSHNLEHERYDQATEPSVPGDPATWVFCEGLCGENLLQSVKAGHMYVTRRGLKLELSILADHKNVLPGDRVSGGARVSFHIASAEAETAGSCHVQWIVNGETRGTGSLQAAGAEFSIEADKLEYGWVRADLRDDDGAFLGFVNPVYWGSKRPGLTTFGQAASGLAIGGVP